MRMMLWRAASARLVLSAALIACSLVRSADAQSIFATLVGVVTDSSGAVVPGATVTVTNVKTQS